MNRRWICALLLLVTTASLLAEPPATMPASKWMRFVRDDRGGGVLQTSVVRFADDHGVSVDLIGAVHVGEKAYYDELETRFAGYDALLFELVKAEGAPVPGAAVEPSTQPGVKPSAALRAVGGIQRFLKDTLKLSFQLEEINYDKPNFVHADLDAATFMRLQNERGEGFLELMIRSMFEGSRNPALAASAPGPLDILNAMRAPDRDRQLKLLFAPQLADMETMSGLLEGPDGSVILTERNKKAIETFDAQRAAGKQKLGIFYGAAHLPGMSKMLADRGFRQVGEPQWLTAWDMRTP
jgi:hypothetical protein